MQDRKLIVVANLLPRKLVGFKSFGMVLCASSTGEDGKERVEFIDPPLSSMPGDRIIGAGLSSLALTAKQCDKKKAFEILAPSLLVNSEGIATWENLELVSATTGENCKAPSLRNCPIH
mmetsp:Transcript_7519/g.7589  ORF Transcript_7519/g.7589 Transcript_7519/m.7589 type:complete len:119 (+) Transcript_7519:668-1024(+)